MDESSLLHSKIWANELNASLLDSNSFCLAAFSTDKQLIFSNEAFDVLVDGDPCAAFINPSFDEFLVMSDRNYPVFEGYLTLGNNEVENLSIQAKVYKKGNQILVTGGVNTKLLMQQNQSMHRLNQEVSNLHREMIKKNQVQESIMVQLNDANKALNKANADKDKMMQIIAHDLRSPFNGILGFSKLLHTNLKKYDTSRTEQMIKMINLLAKDTLGLLDNLLSWARSQNEKIIFKPKKLNIILIINKIIQSTRLTAELKKIEIKLERHEKLYVNADQNMIETVLRNLISNAIKFTNLGGAIHITVKKEVQFAEIKIEDNGIGMNKETAEKLFEISKDSSVLGTANEKGSGLGLIICKDFIEKHKGEIKVESELGKGSQFIFSLPVCKDQN